MHHTTNNKSVWVNTKEYIILHHTGDYSLSSVINTFQSEKSQASCHFVIDRNGEVHTFENHHTILWHAWVSSWGWKKDLNKYSIGIEVIWPKKEQAFTNAQHLAVIDIIRSLQDRYKIPNENILRHKDIAPQRKVDIDDSFWRDRGYASFDIWKKFYFPNTYNMWEYEKLFKGKYGKSSVLNDIEGAIKKTGIPREQLFLQLIMFERLCQKSS